MAQMHGRSIVKYLDVTPIGLGNVNQVAVRAMRRISQLPARNIAAQ